MDHAVKGNLRAPVAKGHGNAGWGKGLTMGVAVLLAGALAADYATAAGKGGSGGGSRASGKSGAHHSGKNHSRHHHDHSRNAVAAGVFVGGPWWPWWDYPAYYPPVALSSVPVVYIERSEQEGQTTGDWLYCANAQGYFPYVAECAEGWERVPASPLK